MPITDQQWLDHANQNVQEFSNRNILLRGDGAPSNIDDPAPFGSFYKDRLTGERYEQVEVDPVSNGYDWQLFETGGSTPGEHDHRDLYEIRGCDSTLAVGDLVWESIANPGEVDEAVNNTDSRRIIGVCVEKPTSTTAKVMFKGRLTGLSSLTVGMKVYCSSGAVITAVLPVSGYVQVLGDAISSTEVDFTPSHQRILRS